MLPAAWQREAALKVLKRTHAWVGLWGAVLGLFFGLTGILMNHRTILPIDAASAVVDQTSMAIDTSAWQKPQDMAAWARATFDIDKPPALLQETPAREVQFEGVAFTQPAEWRALFSWPQRSLNVVHRVGSDGVDLRSTEHNIWSTMNRIHKADGVHVGWVLLADSIAGAFILLSITGLLLWSRLHGGRLLGALLILGSTGWATVSIVTAAL